MSDLRENRTGRWLKQTGKTAKMLEVEKHLSDIEGKPTTLEEDYQKFYFEKNWGQKNLAQRWGVGRSLIFSKHLRGGRRSWSQMLNLKIKGNEIDHKKNVKIKNICEICSDVAPLHKAHYIPYAEGGSSTTWNIIKLCGSCHNKFDLTENKELNLRILKTMFFREFQKIVNNNDSVSEKKEAIYRIVNELLLKGSKYRKIEK